MKEQLEAIKKTNVRVIVLSCIAEYGRLVLDKAFDLKMLGKGWVWIGTEGLVSVSKTQFNSISISSRRIFPPTPL